MLYSDVETTKKVGCYCSSNDKSVGVGRKDSTTLSNRDAFGGPV